MKKDIDKEIKQYWKKNKKWVKEFDDNIYWSSTQCTKPYVDIFYEGYELEDKGLTAILEQYLWIKDDGKKAKVRVKVRYGAVLIERVL